LGLEQCRRRGLVHHHGQSWSALLTIVRDTSGAQKPKQQRVVKA
jgi:hypothetical protein